MSTTPDGPRRVPERPRAAGGHQDGREGYPRDEFDVDYEAGQRRGAHRTATPAVLEQLPWLVAALVAVVAVVAVIVLLTGGTDPRAGTSTTTPSTTEAAGTDPAPTDPAPTTDPPAATTEPPATSEPPVTTSTPAPTADRSLELVVLNGTRVSGLGAATAEELGGLGWTVGTVGNAANKPVATTVVLYSAAEHRATAEAVAADLGATAELDESADAPVVVVVGTDRS